MTSLGSLLTVSGDSITGYGAGLLPVVDAGALPSHRCCPRSVGIVSDTHEPLEDMHLSPRIIAREIAHL